MVEILENEKVFIDNGPIQMVLDISIGDKKTPELGLQVSKYVIYEFNRLAEYIPYIKNNSFVKIKENRPSAVLKKMINAVERSGDKSLTPLAAVAGSFSDFALEKALELGATRVIVNNGGDIALKDITGHPLNVGIPLNDTELVLNITSESNIKGICTSGLGGRSFTKGIATAAVSLGENAAIADACASCLGNATNVDNENIVRCYAEEIDSETDIPGHLVTLKVGDIGEKNVYKALLNGLEKAEELYNKNIIKGAVLCVKDKIVMVPDNIAVLK
ncbi:ApbE family protein [Clostridium pasteurianum DSM 525 = ATCC 6013]|uniref:ApbE family lipoprotein n=1 Tax=Clostridium pasteurianum DSM 525 = ATCC 6013 TaxID=1262449 RepID=A0A0H3J630_CLOPA|nr:UPF0280 family protein [Clostridium pasteurianum]AJA46390.1 ApbE family protein [Clostridium pasteurianum DSM 525 = ATCC 6013]AJA50378.1 ApbE family protein [Clostridium pasteurianum DSM 525 = ATCC 6013]AOZ73827.1 thiamine biosynthesis protein ApbE [Clostridium pasteurianum DSM 525 = ATCC 6013]AOZ77624.1 thiamine biosynthesis protein ApbE [Clostridium pasteurianum]ELP60965.1 hypothetical protein F502_00870 [Clostridium pasteurianum DSM 525 = ATCC 6013]